jgi:uncharacterized protein YjiS (DUF1127 family)
MKSWFQFISFVLIFLHGWRQKIPLLLLPRHPYVAAQQRGRSFDFAREILIRRVDMTPFRTIAEKLSAWRRYREAVRELSQLTDRELDDIGVRRGDIPFIAAGAVRKAA